jgi:hypothetical protein
MTEKGDAPQPDPEWTREKPWEADSLATLEANTDPLDAQLLEQDKRNRLAFKKATGLIIVLAVYFSSALLASGIGVWTWHFLTPWPFLKPPQLEKLQSIIFSGSLGAIVSALARSYLKDK